MSSLLSRIILIFHKKYIKILKNLKKFDPNNTIWDKYLVMGKYSYGTPIIIRTEGDKGNIHIGKFCSVSADVKILIGGEHNTNWITTFPIRIIFNLEGRMKDGHPKSKGEVFIGNDVWIGYSSTILSGVKIGDGAVIGARSLVASDVDPYTVVAGNPSKVIRKRFSDEQIQKLLEIKWWDWELSKILNNTHLLCQDNINMFINKFYKD